MYGNTYAIEREDMAIGTRLTGSLVGLSRQRLRVLIAKDTRLDLRTTRAQKETIRKAARACNMTMTEFITDASILVAQKLNTAGSRRCR